jgi:hypothetical protein
MNQDLIQLRHNRDAIRLNWASQSLEDLRTASILLSGKQTESVPVDLLGVQGVRPKPREQPQEPIWAGTEDRSDQPPWLQQDQRSGDLCVGINVIKTAQNIRRVFGNTVEERFGMAKVDFGRQHKKALSG